ncbi:MAG TPA: DUF1003 domain-containing protein [Nocardioidaceae bacterium]|nr:DUF1003 domain-containing protein [Nocardioidaceae bacterium]
MARDEVLRDEERREPVAATRSAGRYRLDVPRETRRIGVPRPHYNTEAFGNFAERFARFMGTGRFLAYMTIFIIVWIIINLVGIEGFRWDAKPFILLNLLFSIQASYAAPLILLAQNRQEDRDRVVTEQDREINTRAHADMEFLAREVASLRMAVGEVATRDFLRSELRALLADLDDRAGGADGTAATAAAPTDRPPSRTP